MRTGQRRGMTRGTSPVSRAVARAALSLAVVGVTTLSLCTAAGADPVASPPTTTSTAPASAPSGSGTTTTLPTSTPTSTTAPSASTSTTTTTGPVKTAGAAEPNAGSGLNGTGSSFAAPAIETFDQVVGGAPYNIGINYSSTSSGDGRFEFANGTTDFAVSDIAYGLGNADTTPPSFPYIYVPITAGGIAFMYNIPGLTKTLQLTNYTTCAILTGGITNWNDSHIAADNPGVTLPNLPIKPVTESDPAGTNYVLEEWCIAEQPALWSAFSAFVNSQSGNTTTITATKPESQWPALANGLDTDSTSAVASDVSSNAGAIGGVQLQYATDQGFGKADTSKGVASEQNASGAYAQPSSVDVASALAYANQLPDGTHQLNFNGVGPNVYNPSTYSYLLSPAAGWAASKGAVMSQYVNYVLTLGQQKSPSIGYASLGLSLEQWGIDEVTQDVPGAVAVTAAEKAGYACGDLTPGEVAAGQTTPTCGVTDKTAPIPPTSGAAHVGTTGATGSSGASGSGAAGAGGARGSGSGSGSGAGGVDPAVSLSGSSPLAFTGGDPRPVVLIGALLLLSGWVVRRRLMKKRQTRGTS
jgi:phosphate transport system substrate-binding protein